MEEIKCDYLKLGDKTYAIKEVNMPNVDINKELKEAYEKQLKEHVDTFNEGIVTNAHDEWNTQITHLQSVRGRTDIQVPQEYINNNSLVTVRGNRVCECRIIRYAPTEIMCSWNYLPTSVKYSLEEKKSAFSDVGLDTTVLVKLKESLVFPLIIAHDTKVGEMYAINMRYFHAYEDSRICTGDYDAADFWKSDDFSVMINRINWFSPASSYVNYAGGQWALKDYLNNNTLDSVVRMESAQWTVQQ